MVKPVRVPKPERPWACVTDPANRVSLAVVRSLGHAGIRVRLADPDLSAYGIPPGGPAWESRYVEARVRVPSPLAPERFSAAILAATKPGEVILPVSTNSLMAVLGSERLRTERRLPFAPLEEFRRVNSKPSLLGRAAALGLDVPRTVCPKNLEEGLDLARSVSYPCVIKLADDEGSFLPPGMRYAIARDPIDFRERYRELHARRSAPIVQEYVPGEGWGAAFLYWKGRRVAAFCHRRLREYPRSGGPASLAESVHDNALLEAGARLLEGVHWEGVALVEFRRDATTGRTRLMEVNPRFWGTLPLAIRCGVDFPLFLYRLALGEDVRVSTRYRGGVRMRVGALELARLWDAWRGGDPAGALKDAAGWVLDARSAGAIRDARDPAPARRVLRTLVCRAASMRRRGGHS